MEIENQNPNELLPKENLNPQEPQKEDTLKISSEIGNELETTSKWAKFLAILGFVFMGLMIMIGFVVTIAMSFIPQSSGTMPFPPLLLGLFYLIGGAIYFFPILYLFQFSTNIKQALFSKNQNQLGKAFAKLKAHYRFIGILMIVFLALYFVVFIIMIFTGIFAGLSSFAGMQA